MGSFGREFFTAIVFFILILAIAQNAFAAEIFYDPLDSTETVQASGGTLHSVSFIPGIVGNAAKMSSGYIDYPYTGNFNQNQGTIQFLVKPSDSGNMGLLEAGKLGYANSLGIVRAGLYSRAVSFVELRKDNSSYLQAWHDKDPRLENGGWHLVTAVWKCNQGTKDFFQLYIDGVPGYKHSGSSKCTPLKDPATKHIRLGNTYWYGYGSGTYDELKIFDKVRTESQIKKDHKAYLGSITCSSNAECGKDDWVGSPTCSASDGNVLQNYRTYTCSNKATPQSSCSHEDTPRVKEDCGSTSYGEWGPDECSKGNVVNFRTVYNKGCSSRACTSKESRESRPVKTCQHGCQANQCSAAPACSENRDCGENEFVGNPYCSGSEPWGGGMEVLRDYINYTCSNRGTPQADCSSNTAPKVVKNCTMPCVWGSCLNYSGNTPDPIGWLGANQDEFSTGLVESQEGFSDHRAFTYDEALAAVAFTKAGQYARARKLLDKMKALQTKEGYWVSAYYAGTGANWEWNIDSGPIAWMAIAANYYESKTGDKKYAGMAEKALGWLETRIDKTQGSGSYGAVNLGKNFWDVPNPEYVYGTEHQMDAYSAFRNRALLTSNAGLKAKYNAIADDIMAYLVKEVWKQDHFERGFNDSELWLDTQSWAPLALGHTGPNNEDFTKPVFWARENLIKHDIYWDAATPLSGFAYNDYPETSVQYGRTIWVEGTLQMVTAFKDIGEGDLGTYYIGVMPFVTHEDGSLAYSFDDRTQDPKLWPQNLRLGSVSSTAWYYFAENGFNPFGIESGPSPACSQDRDCGTKHFTGTAFCQGKDLYQNAITYTCNKKGTAQATCSNASVPEVKEVCTTGCSNNQCITGPGPGYAWKPLLLHEPFESIAGAEANGWSFSGTGIETQGKIGNAVLGTGPTPATAKLSTDGFINSDQGTVEFWFKPELTHKIGLFEAGAIGSPNSIGVFTMLYGGGNVVVMESRQSDNKLRQSWTKVTKVKKGEWNHVALTWKCNQRDNYVRIYFNGKAGSKEKGACKKMDFSGREFQIGETGYYGKMPMGFDDLRVYSYVKSSSQISKSYKYAKPFEQPLVSGPGNNAQIEESQLFSWNMNGFEKAKIEVSTDPDFTKPKSMSGWLSEGSTSLGKKWKSLLSLEKRDMDKMLYWRVLGKGKDIQEYSDGMAFTIKPLSPPSLSCPSTAVGSGYAFAFDKGGYSKAYLQIGHDQEFAKRTYRQITAKQNPMPIAKYFETLKKYAAKGTEGQLYARIYAKDQVGRIGHSNVCQTSLQG